jgi:hypothetical protein
LLEVREGFAWRYGFASEYKSCNVAYRDIDLVLREA